MEELINALKRYFATHFQYYTKAHGFHVNVVGSDFTERHQLFGKIYEDAQEAIDDIAEHIRACEGIAPFALKRIQELGTIKDEEEKIILHEPLSKDAQPKKGILKKPKSQSSSTENLPPNTTTTTQDTNPTNPTSEEKKQETPPTNTEEKREKNPSSETLTQAKETETKKETERETEN